jgi:hypothetical protein
VSQPPAKGDASKTPVTPATSTDIWEFGDVGFDTDKKLWFVQLTSETNQNVGTYMGKGIALKGGRASQYEWKDSQGRAYWHVRERFFAHEIESIGVDPAGTKVTITFKDADAGQDEDAPKEFSYLLYAFHLFNKEIAKGNRAPFGFVEFYDARGELVKRLNNKRVVVEDIERKSVGEYPKIRLRIEGKDVGKILTTKTTVVVQGKVQK